MRNKKYMIAFFVLLLCTSIALIFTISVFRSNMVLPEQPPLTDRESGYFDTLQNQCACKVIREVDTRKLKDRPDLAEKGFYTIELNKLPCTVIMQKDSLKNASKLIAKKLHGEILGKNYEYPYRSIAVIFSCPHCPRSVFLPIASNMRQRN